VKMFVKSILSALLLLTFPAHSQAVSHSALPANSQTFSFKDKPSFVFGLATAPAHSEDRLEDTWLAFAQKGGVAAWSNTPHPEERLRFWSEPETEIAWAQASGVKSLRLGLDWGRLVPHAPGSNKCGPISACGQGLQNREALEHYKFILRSIRAHGLEPMVTLFHHSLPQWALDMGGWVNPEVVKYFVAFAGEVARECGDLVDEWITFNEPTVFSLLSEVAGLWPPGGEQRVGGLIEVPLLVRGAYWISLENMSEAHNQAYDAIYANDRVVASQGNPYGHHLPVRVGLAHNMSFNNGARWFDWASARYFDAISKYTFTDRVVGKLDFLGINYYGQEVVKGLGAAFVDRAEYSESGRAIYPAGLAALLIDYNQRYNQQKVSRKLVRKELSFVVTENGISDSTDVIRGAYLIEHLAAVRYAMDQGVPVDGYYFWTLSDNWEWADGYCPKFGLLEVDRVNLLQRHPRPSFQLFKEIVENREVRAEQRSAEWDKYLSQTNVPRPQCRAENGRDALNEPRMDMTFRGLDFRFRPEQIH